MKAQLCKNTQEIAECKDRIDTLEGTDPVELTCTELCPVVVGETQSVDSPINMNPVEPTLITWGGWQSQDESVVATSGESVTIASDGVCTAHVVASVTFIDDTAGSDAQRAHPELWLLRNGERVALGQTYVRDIWGHDSDTATISWYDLSPEAGTVYSLQVQQDSIESPATSQADGPLEIYFQEEIANYLQVAAHRTLTLCSPASEVPDDPVGPVDPDDGGNGTGTGETFIPLYAPSDGKIVSDNFQDGNSNSPFNLQVRNTGNATVNWQACTPDVPYETIPNLNSQGVNYVVADNGDGTFKHCFDGIDLGAFATIQITGGLPAPAGQGGTLELYCE